jgi:hypothetical protein
MSYPAEHHAFKGSKGGTVVKATVKGKTELGPRDVAIRITHSGVSL